MHRLQHGGILPAKLRAAMFLSVAIPGEKFSGAKNRIGQSQKIRLTGGKRLGGGDKTPT
jgi:hypothetical protein